MPRFRLAPLVLTAAIANIFCATLLCQPPAQSPDKSAKLRQVPAAVPPSPFSVDAASGATALTIEFRPANEMTDPDRLLAANAESSIAEHARLNGFALDQGMWSYQQVLCPALPNHLFLRYTRNNGTGDVTVFSASIPHNGEGRVRIVPILKRGYSLFSPAPVNALTISAFNHIRAEEPEPQRGQGWLGNGLCYAALAGGHPRVPSADETSSPGKPVPALRADLDVQTKGGETIRFADAAAAPHPMEWTMTFARNGRLVKASHTRVPMYAEKPVPATSAIGPARPVRQDVQ